MKVNSSNYSSNDAQKAQHQQEMQAQRDQAKELQANQQKVEEAAKLTGVGQHLDITS